MNFEWRVVDIPHSLGPMSLTRCQKLLTFKFFPLVHLDIHRADFVVTVIPTPNVPLTSMSSEMELSNTMATSQC